MQTHTPHSAPSSNAMVPLPPLTGGVIRNQLLVIDDEPAFGEFVGKVASGISLQTIVTSTPGAFLDNLVDLPSVVMLDLNIPGTDGIELLRELAERKVKCKILLASGIDLRTLETAERFGRSLGLNMAGTIHKPIRVTELRSLLERTRASAFEPTADALRRAIAEDQLFALFQPQIEIATGRCVCVEMLLRWREPGGSVIMPDMFVPMAERDGVIDKLSAWVLNHGITQAAIWQQEGLDLKIAINMSAINFLDISLPDRVETLCRDAGLPTSKLVLELTETATMRDPALLMAALARLRIKGVALSIDDFGTGYSSMVQLHRLPFCEIKIDKSFVMTMDTEALLIARAITRLGHSLGLSVVAEGVETQDAFDHLSDLGVECAQGYLMSRPISADAIPDFVRARATGSVT